VRRATRQDVSQIRDRASYLYIQHARVEQDQRSIQLVTPTGRVRIPAASLAVLMLGPGTSITHAAMRSLAECGCQVTWTYGDHRRTFAAAVNSNQSSRRALHQAAIVSEPRKRLRIARRMYVARFDKPLDASLNLEQIRGLEGVRVRETYREASNRSGVAWHGRRFGEASADGDQDPVNIALSAASEALYGVCHAAIAYAGWTPQLGIVHTGTATAFVLDIADLYRTHTVIPAAFDVAASHVHADYDHDALRSAARAALRDRLVEHRILAAIVADIDQVMDFRRGRPEADEDEAERRLAGLTLWDPDREVDAGTDHGLR
jgi:CRISPR-associated protein Cas1